MQFIAQATERVDSESNNTKSIRYYGLQKIKEQPTTEHQIKPGPPAGPTAPPTPSLTYVDVTWETCAAAEREQQQQREED